MTFDLQFKDVLAETIERLVNDEGPQLPTALNLRDCFEVYIPVVRDYLGSIRRNDADTILQNESRLLVVLGSLENEQNRLYFRAVLLNRLHREGLRESFPNVYRILIDNIATLNEEQGEIALSVLANSVVSEGDRGKVEKLRQNFQLLNFIRADLKAFAEDVAQPSPHRNPQTRVHEESPTATHLANHFIGVCERLRIGTYLAYPAAATEAEHLVDRVFPDQERLLLSDPVATVHHEVNNLRRLFLRRVPVAQPAQVQIFAGL